MAHTDKTSAGELVSEYADIIKSKTIIVTGVTPGGLGAVYTEAVAAGNPALLIITGRTQTKLQHEVDNIHLNYPNVKVKTLLLDLGSLKAVRAAAEVVKSWTDVPKIDVLVNNAAVMAIDHAVSPDGYEMQFATGHLGHFLFTNLIMEKLMASKTPRVVSVSSDGHRLSHIRWPDVNFDVSQVPDQRPIS